MKIITLVAQDRQKLINELLENHYLEKNWDQHPDKYDVFGSHYLQFAVGDNADINKIMKAGKENISHLIIETDRDKYNEDVCSDVILPKFYKSKTDKLFEQILNGN